MVNELLKRVTIGRNRTVLEPTAGSGQLASALKQAGLWVATNDIAHGAVKWKCTECKLDHWFSEPSSNLNEWRLEPCGECGATNQLTRVRMNVDRYYTDYHFNAATDALWKIIPRPDWVIGNPPFSQLEDILERALANSRLGVAFILRLTALEPACKRSKRGELLEAYADNLRYVMPFSGPRPSFTDDGRTDSVTTAWFVWMHGHSWEDFIGISSPFQFIMNWM
jgi:hypothetical protein